MSKRHDFVVGISFDLKREKLRLCNESLS